jgi:hypothetical protein
MILGLTIPQFTLLHVIISFLGIFSGLFALVAWARGVWLPRTQALFLATTALTSLTGFLFPVASITPAFITGVVATIVMIIALLALYGFGGKGRARAVYAVTATVSLWLNLFVLVVQSFLKVPALNALAPNGNEPPFAIVQGIVLVATVWLGWTLVRGGRQRVAV